MRDKQSHSLLVSRLICRMSFRTVPGRINFFATAKICPCTGPHESAIQNVNKAVLEKLIIKGAMITFISW